MSFSSFYFYCSIHGLNQMHCSVLLLCDCTLEQVWDMTTASPVVDDTDPGFWINRQKMLFAPASPGCFNGIFTYYAGNPGVHCHLLVSMNRVPMLNLGRLIPQRFGRRNAECITNSHCYFRPRHQFLIMSITLTCNGKEQSPVMV